MALPHAAPLDHELRLRALRVRVEAAVDSFEEPIAPHPNNGDEARYPNKIGTDTRGLPHDRRGEVDLEAYRVVPRQRHLRRSPGPLGQAGIHWRTDAAASLALGEQVAISLLRDERRTFREPFEGFTFTRFDGTRITV